MILRPMIELECAAKQENAANESIGGLLAALHP